jgi:hypothetical protein
MEERTEEGRTEGWEGQKDGNDRGLGRTEG